MLGSFSQATPSDLFRAKIAAEEYGNALELARKYALDTDVLYQAQWQRNGVTHQTVRDYLHRVGDKAWVLKEVLRAVGATAKGTR